MRAEQRTDGVAEATEGPWELPEGWTWVATERVAHVNPSTTFDDLAGDDEIGFVPMAAVSEETGAVALTERRTVAAVSKGYVRFTEGDVLFAKITPCMENGKVAPVVSLPNGFGAGSTEFHVLRPFAVDQRYLWRWLVSLRFRQEAERNMSGSAGQMRVPVGYLKEKLLPLPPLPEQRRIVARIDELFAEIDEGEAALRRAKAGLETQRRALLKAAVTGALTEDWRAANPPEETGVDLLARLRAERAARGGKRSKPLPKAHAPGLPELPEGWAWATLGEMFQVFTGATPSRAEPDYWNGFVPWVSSGEVAFCRIRTTKETISETGLNNSSARINPAGTLLLAMIGEGKTRGQCAILDIPAANNQNAAAIRVSETPVPPEYIYWVLRSRYEALRKGSQGGNQPALNAAKVSEISVPLPSLTEIAEVLERLADALSAVDELETLVAAQLKSVAALRQSVLKAAFEGRLVPQDPSDEPASALLARLAPPSPARRRGRPPKRR